MGSCASDSSLWLQIKCAENLLQVNNGDQCRLIDELISIFLCAEFVLCGFRDMLKTQKDCDRLASKQSYRKSISVVFTK